jgi:CRP-like cAMP-binding protein
VIDVERLRDLPLFEELDYHDLAVVARHAGEATAAAGEVLFEQGAIPYELFVIEAGTAEVTRDGEVLGSIGPGDVVGEMGLMRLERRTATVRATSSLRAVTIRAEDLQVLEGEMPEVAAQLRSIMSARDQRDDA